MRFYEIEFPLGSLDSESVEAALLEAGASSITFVDRGDEPVLEPKPGEVVVERERGMDACATHDLEAHGVHKAQVSQLSAQDAAHRRVVEHFGNRVPGLPGEGFNRGVPLIAVLVPVVRAAVRWLPPVLGHPTACPPPRPPLTCRRF